MAAPWFVGGGAEHSPETARLLSFAATSGATGIIGPGAYKVATTAVPSTSVRVLPGAAVMANSFTGGSFQSYMTRRGTEALIPITATGAGGGRTDLIIQRIDDPQYGGQGVATDPTFVFDPFVVIPGVAAGIRGVEELNLAYPAVALARVTLPASTGTVQVEHIVDLRKLANPRRERALVRHQPSVTFRMPNAWGLWPAFQPLVYVPNWATHAIVIISLTGAHKPVGGGIIGDVAVLMSPSGQAGVQAPGTVFEFDANTTNVRPSLMATAEFDVIAVRGLERAFSLVGQRNPTFSAVDGHLDSIDRTFVVYDIEFQERAI